MIKKLKSLNRYISLSLLVFLIFTKLILISSGAPNPVTNLQNISSETYINWTWSDPSGSFDDVQVFINGSLKANISRSVRFYNASNLQSDTTYIIGTRSRKWFNEKRGPGRYEYSIWNNQTSKTTPDRTPPLIIKNLNNVSYAANYINWTWIDPTTDDFSEVMIYINGSFKENVTKGVQYYNSTGLIYGTEYNISTRTIDINRNINLTWVNRTARTAPDNTPPVTEINLSGNLITYPNWYDSEVEVSFSAIDDISGLQRTEYYLDNGSSWDGNWIIYSSPFNVREEGDTVVRYRSIDHIGNVESINGTQIRIDTIPPQINISNLDDGGLYTTDVNPIINILEINDPQSIIKTLNGNSYSDQLITAEGNYLLNVSVVDITQHIVHNNISFIIDKTPPQGINDLNNDTFEPDYINWTWTDPSIFDLSYVKVYIDGQFQADVPGGIQFYSAENLDPNTQYEIGARTVDLAGNINQTWANHTARTSPLPPIPEQCVSSCSVIINYIIHSETGFEIS